MAFFALRLSKRGGQCGGDFSRMHALRNLGQTFLLFAILWSIEQFVQGISSWYLSSCILLSISKWRRQGKGFKSLIMAWAINTCSATSPQQKTTLFIVPLQEWDIIKWECHWMCLQKRQTGFQSEEDIWNTGLRWIMCLISRTKKTERSELQSSFLLLFNHGLFVSMSKNINLWMKGNLICWMPWNIEDETKSWFLQLNGFDWILGYYRIKYSSEGTSSINRLVWMFAPEFWGKG